MHRLMMIPLLDHSDRQDLYSVAYVRSIVAAAGFNFSKSELDRNSDDLHIEQLQKDGFSPTYGRLIVQVKCTFAHTIESDGCIHYPLPVRNYDHLRAEKIEPRILVVVLVPRPDSNPHEPWIECTDNHTILRYKAYWKSLIGEPEKSNTSSVTVKIPQTNIFDIDAVLFLMDQMVARGMKWLSARK